MKTTSKRLMLIGALLLLFGCTNTPDNIPKPPTKIKYTKSDVASVSISNNDDTLISVSRLNDDSVVTLTLIREITGDVRILSRSVMYNTSTSILNECHFFEQDIDLTEDEVNHKILFEATGEDHYWLIPHDGSPAIDITWTINFLAVVVELPGIANRGNIII